MEHLCDGLSTRTLPLVGHTNDNFFAVHLYLAAGRTKLAHTLWYGGKLGLIVLDSWLWNFVSIHSLPEAGWPKEPYENMHHFGVLAFTHLMNALTNKDFGELNLAVQTQYAMQIINGASDLPIHQGVYSRVYSAKPFVIEVKA